MSSSSSDSDSDDFEPIRRIKINIRPKEDVGKGRARVAADVSEIKASVEAWRPLGPPTHPSLSRRQSSLSSVSSMSFGASGSGSGTSVSTTANTSAQSYATTTGAFGGGYSVMSTNSTIRSSPSCSSLVNEINNRSSFSNFMSATTSRTSSPLTLIQHGDSAVPVAIAIQESIELIVKGHFDPNAIEPNFQSRSIGNIKVAFPNAFAKGSYGKLSPNLKLRLHSTENIIKYYASRLIKDLDLGITNMLTDQKTDAFFHNTNQQINTDNNNINGAYSNKNSTQQIEPQNFKKHSIDDFGTTSFDYNSLKNSKVIEFNTDILMSHLKKMYDQSPTARYYNVDVLRYQISPIRSITESPLQVCAYWRIEPKMVKLRIDFKHSNKSGLSLERLRELSFCVSFAGFIPPETDINSLSPDSLTTLRLNNNNNAGAFDMNITTTGGRTENMIPQNQFSLVDDQDHFGKQTMNNSLSMSSLNFNARLPPPPPPIAVRNSLINNSKQTNKMRFNYIQDMGELNRDVSGLGEPIPPSTSGLLQSISEEQGRAINMHGNLLKDHQSKTPPCSNTMPPYITYKPQAHWNNSIKQLTWKFDTLLSYHKTDGLGSLFAKLDFRNYIGMQSQFLEKCSPTPVEVKFLVTDSTLSKINMSIDSIGYKMSLLKKEIRSGRYRSEPYVL